MSLEKKVPEIRFKVFNKEWTHLNLGENAKFTKGQGYSKGDLVASGTPIILYGRLYTKYQTVITSVDTLVTEKDKPIKSMGGEVIVPASGESPEDISRASVVSEPNVILGGDLNIVSPNEKINSTFLALAISNGRLKKELSSKAQGKSVVHIRNSDLADLDLILPAEYIEQTVIGNYFQKLDVLINKHQQKHDKLNSIKKSMLKKMFPKQGESIPDIRFKGFSGEWDEISLLDSIERIIDFRGRTPKKLGLDWSTSGYRALSALNVKQGYIDFSIDPHFGDQELYDKWMNGSELHQGQVLFTTEAPMGNVAQVPNTDKYILSQRTIAFVVKSEIISEDFLAVLLRSYNVFRELSALSSGGTAKGVSQKVLANLNVSIPTDLVEQTAIGNYFKKLDALINQHQQQITKLNNVKQASLSKMFV